MGQERLQLAMPGEPRALWASNRVCEAAVRHRKQEQHLANLRNVCAPPPALRTTCGAEEWKAPRVASACCAVLTDARARARTFVAQAKPLIDMRDPRRPKSSNSKGARLEEERNNQIMHENTILLNKLSRILTREPAPLREPMLVRGLNEVHRKEERERIDRENQALLRRLQDVRPSIDGERLEEQYAMHEWMVQNHSKSFVANPFLGATAADGSVGDGSSRIGSAKAARPVSAAARMGGGAGDALTEVAAAPPSSAGEGGLPAVAEAGKEE